MPPNWKQQMLATYALDSISSLYEAFDKSTSDLQLKHLGFVATFKVCVDMTIKSGSAKGSLGIIV